jgi:hypothetical protein
MLFQILERLAEGEDCRTLIQITHSIQANAADPVLFGLRGATVEHFNQGMHRRLSPRGILLNLPDVQEQPDNS